MNTNPQCLVVSADREFLGQIERFFQTTQPGYEVVTFASSVEALEQARSQKAALLVTSYLLPQIDGLHLIQSVRAFDADVPIIMISDVPVEVAALSHGATAFLDTDAWWTKLDAEVSALVAAEEEGLRVAA